MSKKHTDFEPPSDESKSAPNFTGRIVRLKSEPGRCVSHYSIELILAGSQQDPPVVSNSEVVGILTLQDLLMALAKRGKDASVLEVMQDDFLVVDSAEMLETAFQKLQQCHCHTVPVQQLNKLVGLLSMDNVGESVSITSALRNQRASTLQPFSSFPSGSLAATYLRRLSYFNGFLGTAS